MASHGVEVVGTNHSQGKVDMLKSGKHPGELKDAVCTPGGTTIEGISALEEKGFRNALIYAVDKVMEKKHSM